MNRLSVTMPGPIPAIDIVEDPLSLWSTIVREMNVSAGVV